MRGTDGSAVLANNGPSLDSPMRQGPAHSTSSFRRRWTRGVDRSGAIASAVRDSGSHGKHRRTCAQDRLPRGPLRGRMPTTGLSSPRRTRRRGGAPLAGGRRRGSPKRFRRAACRHAHGGARWAASAIAAAACSPAASTSPVTQHCVATGPRVCRGGWHNVSGTAAFHSTADQSVRVLVPQLCATSRHLD
jgi:hypothetical protein